jgi:hypothetical protein
VYFRRDPRPPTHNAAAAATSRHRHRHRHQHIAHNDPIEIHNMRNSTATRARSSFGRGAAPPPPPPPPPPTTTTTTTPPTKPNARRQCVLRRCFRSGRRRARTWCCSSSWRSFCASSHRRLSLWASKLVMRLCSSRTRGAGGLTRKEPGKCGKTQRSIRVAAIDSRAPVHGCARGSCCAADKRVGVR